MKNVEDEIAEMLKRKGLRVKMQVRFGWLTNRVPTEPDPELFPRTKDRLLALHSQLGGDMTHLQEKPRRPLTIGIQVGDTNLVEVDDLKHFSTNRLNTLESYDGLDHHLHIDLYARLCRQYKEDADKVDRANMATGFDFVGGRNAQRAYFDAVKDITSAAHGFRLIRVPIPDGELTSVSHLMLRTIL